MRLHQRLAAIVVGSSVFALSSPVLGFAPSGAIEGHVRDAGGKPVANALVAAMSDAVRTIDDSMRPVATTRSAVDGRFRLDGLAAATYALTATSPKLAAAYRPDVKLADGAAWLDSVSLEVVE